MLKYLIVIFYVVFTSCNNVNIQEVNLIPKPQKLEISEGSFYLNHTTNLITDSSFYKEAEYLKEILNLNLTGKGNKIEGYSCKKKN